MRCERTSSTNTVISAYKMRKSVGKIFLLTHEILNFDYFIHYFCLDFCSLYLCSEMMLRAVFKFGQGILSFAIHKVLNSKHSLLEVGQCVHRMELIVTGTNSCST